MKLPETCPWCGTVREQNWSAIVMHIRAFHLNEQPFCFCGWMVPDELPMWEAIKAHYETCPIFEEAVMLARLNR